MYLVIDKDLTIIAESGGMLFLSGSSQTRIFEISTGATVHIEGLKIICGTDMNSRCIKNEGDLILKDMCFENSGDPILLASMIENTGTIKIQGTTNIKK